MTDKLIYVLVVITAIITSIGETTPNRSLSFWLLMGGTLAYVGILSLNAKLANPLPIVVLAMVWNAINAVTVTTLTVVFYWGNFKNIPVQGYLMMVVGVIFVVTGGSILLHFRNTYFGAE